MAILDGLDRIDWSSLSHAYGSAADVPDLLRALINPEAAPKALRHAAQKAGVAVRELVIGRLWGNVFHQGSVWEASSHTIPFLLEILLCGRPDSNLRTFLVTYLHHLVMGYPEDFFPQKVDPSQLSGKWSVACCQALRGRLGDLLPFADDDEEGVAVATIALFSAFPEMNALLAPPLWEILASREGMRAAHAIVVLAHLEGAAAHPAAEWMVASKEPLVAIFAACASVLADCEGLSDRSTDLLTRPLGELAKVSTPLTGTVAALVGRCTALLPERHRERAVESLARQHEGSDPLTVLSLTDSLLDLAFRGQAAPAQAQELTALQRRALVAIRDHGAWSVAGVKFVNYSSMMGNWNLPADRDLLAQWLG